MRKVKKIIFKIHDVEVDSVDGDEIDLQEIENLKVVMAFAYGVGAQEIEVSTKDIFVYEKSKNLSVNSQGLQFKVDNADSIYILINAVAPSLNIKSEENLELFLGFIFNKDIDRALNFGR